MENKNGFYDCEDFITKDPSYGFKFSHGLELYTLDNSYIRFNHWASPEELKNKTVLDIGCKVASAGGYTLMNGASKYVGIDNNQTYIDIAEKNLKKYYSASDWKLFSLDAKNFLEQNTQKFDFVFVGRVLNHINDGYSFIESISKIANTIIIEDAHPPMFLLNELAVSEAILKDVELNYPICETHYFHNIFQDYKNYPNHKITSQEDSLLGSAYSIGFLKRILNQLGFQENLSPYYSIKKIFPDEYGYGIYKQRDGIKKFIIRFERKNGN
jgi:precorrin-6B methylase 2